MKKHLVLTPTGPMSKQEWLNFRSRGIGASEIGAVMGLSPYKASIMLFYEKLMRQIETQENEAMHWGKALESLIAERWQYWGGDVESYLRNFDAGNIVRRCRRVNAYIQNPAHPELFVSLDRAINKGDDESERSLECKCISGWVVDKWEHGIPPSYVMQLQQQLMVCEFKSGEIAMLKDGRYMEVLPFDINPDICNSIKESSQVFWNRVKNARDEMAKYGFEYYSDDMPMEVKQAVAMHEPEPDGSMAYEDFLKNRWKGKEPERAGTEAEYQLAMECNKFKLQIEQLEAQEREVKNKLRASVGDVSAVTFGKAGNISWRPNKNGVRTFRIGIKENVMPQFQIAVSN